MAKTPILLLLIFGLVKAIKKESLDHQVTTTSSDIRQIKKLLPDFGRPNFKQIPYLIQRSNIDGGTTDYLYPPVEPGQLEARIAFARPSIDGHSQLLIFPTGSYQWRQPILRKYTILRRHSKKIPVYFLAYAYVRQNGADSIIEWEVEDLTLSPQKSRIEQEICRGEECDLPEWILGTCPILSHKCHIQLQKEENETLASHLKTEEAMTTMSTESEESDENLDPLSSISDSQDSSSSSNDFEGVHQRRRRRMRRSSVKHFKKKFRPSSSSPPKMKPDVPSSLDLLFIKMPDDDLTTTAGQQPREEKVGGKFKKRISRRHHPNMEQVMHLLKCRDCQKSGDFYADLEEEPIFNRILGNKLTIQLKNMTTTKLNWRRFPWIRLRPSVLAPYVGFGECSSMILEEERGGPGSETQKPISKEMDDVIEFYLDTLRLDCDTALKNEVRSWLTSKWRFVQIVQDLSFEFLENSKLLKYPILTPKEFERVMAALFFTKYSTVYREQSGSKGQKEGGQSSGRWQLLGHPLSSKTTFLTRMFLKIIDAVHKHLKHHIVKVSRGLARVLKDKFYALLRVKSGISIKKETKKGGKKNKKENLLKENYRDRIQIMALKEFILYGLNPIFRSGAHSEVAFQSFYQLNQNRIRFLVHSYGFDGDSN